MKKNRLLFLFFLTSFKLFSAETDSTLTWDNLIKEYQKLEISTPFFRFNTSDPELPVLLVDKSRRFIPLSKTDTNKVTLWVMNGIHPGESEGIDATLIWIKKMAAHPNLIPDNVLLVIIPCYNKAGMKNRKKYTRCGQNGPDEKGFRGDASNFDLNRDFIKADSRQTLSFEKLFQYWNPDVLIDTHTSNGADYQYTMTLISTQKDKLGGEMGSKVYEMANTFLYSEMNHKGWEMSPYIHVFGKSPFPGGFEQFIETPKFSTGYAALFHTLGFVAETHMLKPYPMRVKATLALLETLLDFCRTRSNSIRICRLNDLKKPLPDGLYHTNFHVSRLDSIPIEFKGFAYEESKSTLGIYSFYSYNRAKPFTATIPYFNTCRPALSIVPPSYYIIPANWEKAIERLKLNGVSLNPLKADTQIAVSVYRISGIEFSRQPYEGHFPHKNIQTSKTPEVIHFAKGDYLLPLKPEYLNYVMECLEPGCEDGFFAWNFFDPILNQKEGYSAYVFEFEAKTLLEKFPEMKEKFEKWKSENPDKLKSQEEVLNYLYSISPYMEKEFRRYPVYRIE